MDSPRPMSSLYHMFHRNKKSDKPLILNALRLFGLSVLDMPHIESRGKLTTVIPEDIVQTYMIMKLLGYLSLELPARIKRRDEILEMIRSQGYEYTHRYWGGYNSM